MQCDAHEVAGYATAVEEKVREPETVERAEAGETDILATARRRMRFGAR